MHQWLETVEHNAADGAANHQKILSYRNEKNEEEYC